MSVSDFLVKLLFEFAKPVVKWVVEWLPDATKSVRDYWTGKCIAIIGPTASGKNSMFGRLKKEAIPSEHIQTRGTDKVKSFKVSWPLPTGEHVKFYCRRSLNVGGEIDERERYWLQACEKADVIFYLIDSSKLRADPEATIARFRDDMRWIATNFRHFQAEVTMHLLLNKVDESLGPYPYPTSALNEVAELVGRVTVEAKNELGDHSVRMKSVMPISMSDEALFSMYFSRTLLAVAQLHKK